MRPRSIVQFEWVYLGSILLGIVAAYLVADTTAAMMQNGGLAISDAMLVTGQWVMSAIFVAIALLASRRASNVARWVVVVLSVFGVVSFLVSLPGLPLLGPVAIIAVAQAVLSAVVLWLLFRPDARAWFRGTRA